MKQALANLYKNAAGATIYGDIDQVIRKIKEAQEG